MSESVSNPLPRPRSFVERIRAAQAMQGQSEHEDAWIPTLRTLRGRVGSDGVERVSTYDVFEALEIPVRRRSSVTVRLSRLMRSLGWANIRARGLGAHSYRHRVRGFARQVHGHPETARNANEF
jgi:hypothetical protein